MEKIIETRRPLEAPVQMEAGSAPATEALSPSELREIAEDTLQTLIEFTDHLEAFSYQSADALSQGGGRDAFLKLLDGIETFSESIRMVRATLRIGALHESDLLEADLLSVLKDLLSYYEQGDRSYVCDLLRQALPTNIREWRERGIPALIRSRDS